MQETNHRLPKNSFISWLPSFLQGLTSNAPACPSCTRKGPPALAPAGDLLATAALVVEPSPMTLSWKLSMPTAIDLPWLLLLLPAAGPQPPADLLVLLPRQTEPVLCKPLDLGCSWPCLLLLLLLLLLHLLPMPVLLAPHINPP